MGEDDNILPFDILDAPGLIGQIQGFVMLLPRSIFAFTENNFTF